MVKTKSTGNSIQNTMMFFAGTISLRLSLCWRLEKAAACRLKKTDPIGASTATGGADTKNFGEY
jgi:hypothetical protein